MGEERAACQHRAGRGQSNIRHEHVTRTEGSQFVGEWNVDGS